MRPELQRLERTRLLTKMLTVQPLFVRATILDSRRICSRPSGDAFRDADGNGQYDVVLLLVFLVCSLKRLPISIFPPLSWAPSWRHEDPSKNYPAHVPQTC
ncbi:hypothetical protein V6N13_011658 [Hibiscus sabdariffa]|uniref:Uncharacterized protein n=1 Tax=Hibiscus sabdariffa TaxID=183260 RepID=A0ABR2SDI2_9ROSI